MDPTVVMILWKRERQAELAEATVQGAHREVFRFSAWWGTSFVRENLGQDRPASVHVGVSSRRSVQPGLCNHSPGPETGEADTN